jgi:hypothetical protein
MPRDLVRWGGLAAMVGGVLWIVVFTIYASRPSGAGLTPPYRSFEGLGLPALISLLLVVVGLVGLHARQRGLYGRLGTSGFVLALVGAALIVASGGSWPLVFIAFFLLMLGSLLVGVATLLANALPRWGAVLLIVGSVVLFFFNTETAQAWLALPYGVAWASVGYLLFSERGAASAGQPARVR